MADEFRSARQALGRGATSEALVHLWNAVEPARLAGDAGRLRAIAGLAQRIRAQGDEAEGREAEQLVEAVRGTVESGEAVAPATGRLDAQVSAGGETFAQTYDDVAVEPEDEGAQRASRIGNLIWLALVVVIVLVNVLSQVRGGD